MTDTANTTMVSQCVAIQYGLLSAGVVLLIIATWHWYQNWSSTCVSGCTSTYHVCKKACNVPTPETPVPATSTFATKPQPRPLHGKISDKSLQENFLSYRADESSQDFASHYANIDNDPDNPPYDPAKDSLDQSVYDSHKEFVDESYVNTQGPNSTNVERDDPNDTVKWVGLRRPDYGGVNIGDDSRSVPSEYPDQMGPATDPSMVF